MIYNKPVINREITVPELKKLLEYANNEIIRKDRMIKQLKSGEKVEDNDSDSESTIQSMENSAALS